MMRLYFLSLTFHLLLGYRLIPVTVRRRFLIWVTSRSITANTLHASVKSPPSIENFGRKDYLEDDIDIDEIEEIEETSKMNSSASILEDMKRKVLKDLFPETVSFKESYEFFTTPAIDDASNPIISNSNILPQRTLDCLDVTQLLQILQNETKTELGREGMIHSQSFSVQGVRSQYEMIDQIRHHIEYLPLQSSFSNWKFLNSIIHNTGNPPRAAYANFSVDFEEILTIQDYISRQPNSLSFFQSMASNDLNLPCELVGTFNKSFLVGDANDCMFNLEKYPSLRRIMNQISSVKSQMKAVVEKLAASPSMRNKLLVEGAHERDGRYVLVVRRASRKGIGIIRAQSKSGNTVFIEPYEILEFSKQLEDLYDELQEEEGEILRQMNLMIRRYKDDILNALKAVTFIDILQAKASIGEKLEGIIPEVGDEGHIYCADAKHPLLLLRHNSLPHSVKSRRKGIVGNTMELNEHTPALVISGPNAGGKTVVLKTCGLYGYMIRYAIPVPAQSGARFDIFHDIMADIGDIQSVLSDLSTFSGHLVVCREIVERVKARAEENELAQITASDLSNSPSKTKKYSLVLMDEIGTGTDPMQGAALAESILEELTSFHHTRLIVTTHFNRIKELASTNPYLLRTDHDQDKDHHHHAKSDQRKHGRKKNRYQVAAMEFIQDKPTYRLKLGSVGESHALELAKRLNIPNNILDRAYNLLDDETKRLVQLQTRLQEETEAMHVLQQQYEKKLNELTQREVNVQNITERLQTQIQRIRDGKVQEFYLDIKEKEHQFQQSLQRINEYEMELSNKLEKLAYYEKKEMEERSINESSAASSLSSSIPPNINSQELLLQEMKRMVEETKQQTEEEVIAKALVRFNANPLVPGEPIDQGNRVIVLEPGIFQGRSAYVTQKNKGKGKVLIRIDGLGEEIKIERHYLGKPKTINELKQNIDQLSAKERKLLKIIEEEVIDVPELMSDRALKKRKKALAESNEARGQSVKEIQKENENKRTEANTLDVRKVVRFDEFITSYDDFLTKQLDDYEPTKRHKGRITVYIQHGVNHPLKGKFRNWLDSNDMVKSYSPAILSEGGDSFTVVEVAI